MQTQYHTPKSLYNSFLYENKTISWMVNVYSTVVFLNRIFIALVYMVPFHWEKKAVFKMNLKYIFLYSETFFVK